MVALSGPASIVSMACSSGGGAAVGGAAFLGGGSLLVAAAVFGEEVEVTGSNPVSAVQRARLGRLMRGHAHMTGHSPEGVYTYLHLWVEVCAR